MVTIDRRSNRFPLALPCQYRLRGSDVPGWHGVVGDVSRQGCCLHGDGPAIEAGADLELHVGPSSTAESAAIVGRVAWRRETPTGWDYGIEFREIDAGLKHDLIDEAYGNWRTALEQNAEARGRRPVKAGLWSALRAIFRPGT